MKKIILSRNAAKATKTLLFSFFCLLMGLHSSLKVLAQDSNIIEVPLKCDIDVLEKLLIQNRMMTKYYCLDLTKYPEISFQLENDAYQLGAYDFEGNRKDRENAGSEQSFESKVCGLPAAGEAATRAVDIIARRAQINCRKELKEADVLNNDDGSPYYVPVCCNMTAEDLEEINNAETEEEKKKVLQAKEGRIQCAREVKYKKFLLTKIPNVLKELIWITAQKDYKSYDDYSNSNAARAGVKSSIIQQAKPILKVEGYADGTYNKIQGYDDEVMKDFGVDKNGKLVISLSNQSIQKLTGTFEDTNGFTATELKNLDAPNLPTEILEKMKSKGISNLASLKYEAIPGVCDDDSAANRVASNTIVSMLRNYYLAQHRAEYLCNNFKAIIPEASCKSRWELSPKLEGINISKKKLPGECSMRRGASISMSFTNQQPEAVDIIGKLTVPFATPDRAKQEILQLSAALNVFQRLGAQGEEAKNLLKALYSEGAVSDYSKSYGKIAFGLDTVKAKLNKYTSGKEIHDVLNNMFKKIYEGSSCSQNTLMIESAKKIVYDTFYYLKKAKKSEKILDQFFDLNFEEWYKFNQYSTWAKGMTYGYTNHYGEPISGKSGHYSTPNFYYDIPNAGIELSAVRNVYNSDLTSALNESTLYKFNPQSNDFTRYTRYITFGSGMHIRKDVGAVFQASNIYPGRGIFCNSAGDKFILTKSNGSSVLVANPTSSVDFRVYTLGSSFPTTPKGNNHYAATDTEWINIIKSVDCSKTKVGSPYMETPAAYSETLHTDGGIMASSIFNCLSTVEGYSFFYNRYDEKDQTRNYIFNDFFEYARKALQDSKDGKVKKDEYSLEISYDPSILKRVHYDKYHAHETFEEIEGSKYGFVCRGWGSGVYFEEKPKDGKPPRFQYMTRYRSSHPKNVNMSLSAFAMSSYADSRQDLEDVIDKKKEDKREIIAELTMGASKNPHMYVIKDCNECSCFKNPKSLREKLKKADIYNFYDGYTKSTVNGKPSYRKTLPLITSKENLCIFTPIIPHTCSYKPGGATNKADAGPTYKYVSCNLIRYLEDRLNNRFIKARYPQLSDKRVEIIRNNCRARKQYFPVSYDLLTGSAKDANLCQGK